PARGAWYYLLRRGIGFMLGRFGGSALMKNIPAPAPSLDLLSRLPSFHNRRALSEWSRIGLGTRTDWLFSLHHVPYNFRAQHQESWPTHKTWFVSPGDGDSRRRGASRYHGANLRCHQHSHCLCHPSRLLPLHFLFRRKRL